MMEAFKEFIMVNYKIRPLRPEDVSDVIAVGLSGTYQYSRESLLTWMKYDPEGLYVAVLDSGKIIGVIGAVVHNDEIAFGGAFCVLKEYRDSDVGHKLLSQSLKHIGNRNTGLNCTDEKLRIYKNQGFTVIEESWQILEFEYLGPLKTEVLSDNLPKVIELKPFDESHLDLIYAYDRMLVGYDRKEMIRENCEEPTTKTFVAFRRGMCVGYGSVKLNIFDAARVGPLYCNDQSAGEVMFKRLLEQMPNAKGLALSTLSNNLIANACIKRMEIPVHDVLNRLYTKEKMILNTGKIFACFDVDFSPF